MRWMAEWLAFVRTFCARYTTMPIPNSLMPCPSDNCPGALAYQEEELEDGYVRIPELYYCSECLETYSVAEIHAYV